jgi:ABC-type multidrug transport system permease subunit
LYKERAIKKQDTKDDTFNPFEDKDQSTPNHFKFWIAKYIKQLFFEISLFLLLLLLFFFFFFFNNYTTTLNTLTIQQETKNRQRTNANENGIQI